MKNKKLFLGNSLSIKDMKKRNHKFEHFAIDYDEFLNSCTNQPWSEGFTKKEFDELIKLIS